MNSGVFALLCGAVLAGQYVHHSLPHGFKHNKNQNYLQELFKNAVIIATVALLVVTGLPPSSNQPAYPLWPNQFTQNLSDAVYTDGAWQNTNATYYYDYTSK